MNAERFHPAENTTQAVRIAMVELFQAQAAADDRLAALAVEVDELKSEGQHAIAEQKVEEIAATKREIARLEAVGEQLDKEFAAAVQIEAGKAAMQRVGQAQDAIAKFNAWLDKSYEPAAKKLAEGVALEKEALGHIEALQGFSAAMGQLPKLRQVYLGREGRSLSALVKLPAAQPGQPIHWGN